MKDVFLKIKGIQEINGEKESIEFMTEAKMRFENGETVLDYSEGELLGEDNVRTELRICRDNTVILDRTGDMNSKLVIKEGERNTCIYATPFTSFTIGVFGKSVKNLINENGGRLEMVYNLDSDLQTLSHNTLTITVEGEQNNVNDSFKGQTADN